MNKQQIEKQIEENNKVMGYFNSLLNEFADKQYLLEKQLKAYDELKLVDGYAVYFNGSAKREDAPRAIEYGYCYPTKELAKIAFGNEKTRNKLEAYSRAIAPDWVEVWNKEQENYFITLEDEVYYASSEYQYKQLGTTYMSEKAAKRIAKALNDSEITL